MNKTTLQNTSANAPTLRKFRWFWPWQDQQEEEWLQEMARTGWHLRTSDGVGLYTFAKGEPAEVVYRLDYTHLQKNEKAQYLQLFQDADWEYVGEMNGWQYFRKPVTAGQTAEIFTDSESKIQKYRRFLYATIPMLPIYLLLLLVLEDQTHPVLMGMVIGVLTGVVLLLAVIAFKVYRRIGQLKKL